MTTSLKILMNSITSLEDTQISPVLFGYFHSTVRNEAHDELTRIFKEENERHGVTRAFLGRRIGKSPEQITRWMGSPGNWTLDTLTNLALALGYRPRIRFEKIHQIENTQNIRPPKSPTVSLAMSTPNSSIATSLMIKMELDA